MARILSIDTSDNKKTEITIEDGKNTTNLFSESSGSKAESAILLIDSLLKKSNTSVKDLDGIKVKTGKGSFTGIRVGVAIANALGYLLKIPINGKRVGELEKPVYNN